MKIIPKLKKLLSIYDMYDKNKILAFIPARGGSKGLPGKNIRLLMGKPLLTYAIESIYGSKYKMDAVISTDSKEIAAIGEPSGVRTIFRPEYLSTDTSLVKDALAY